MQFSLYFNSVSCLTVPVVFTQFYLDLASSSVKARLATHTNSNTSITIENGSSTASTSTLQPPLQAIAEKEVDHLISTIRALLEEIKDAAALRTAHKRVKQGSMYTDVQLSLTSID
jgi:hypothetical protein